MCRALTLSLPLYYSSLPSFAYLLIMQIRQWHTKCVILWYIFYGKIKWVVSENKMVTWPSPQHLSGLGITHGWKTLQSLVTQFLPNWSPPFWMWDSPAVFHQSCSHGVINVAARAASVHSWVKLPSSWHGARWLTLWSITKWSHCLDESPDKIRWRAEFDVGQTSPWLLFPFYSLFVGSIIFYR